jgi:DNA-binding NtrC family response regulator
MTAGLPRLLVLDDDEIWLRQVPLIFSGICEVDGFSTIDQGLMAIANRFYDIVLLDLNFDGDSRSGLDIFRKIRVLDRGTDVIVVSAETDHLKIIEVFNAGAARLIPKCTGIDALIYGVKEVLEQRSIRRTAVEAPFGEAGIALIGSSPEMQYLRDEIHHAVKSGIRDVLIQGETGTGKELVAKSIAFQADPSLRLIPVHCGAISENLAESEFFGHVKGAFTGADREKIGVFEAAAGGFVFLDEIAELPLNQQIKLLRVLQERKVQRVGSFVEKEVNFRCIAATHVDLKVAVAKKLFREDLYYRVAAETIYVPALRKRPQDIPVLAYHFLSRNRKTAKFTFSGSAMELLQAYNGPRI